MQEEYKSTIMVDAFRVEGAIVNNPFFMAGVMMKIYFSFSFPWAEPPRKSSSANNTQKGESSWE